MTLKKRPTRRAREMNAADRWEKTLLAQIKSSEALAALLAKHIPPEHLPQVARLLHEVDPLMVAGLLERERSKPPETKRTTRREVRQ